MNRNLGYRAAPGAATLVLACLAWLPGCGLPAFLVNYTESLGGTAPGERGSLGVIVVNNTPFFASFTIGVFDPLYEAQTLTGYDPEGTATEVDYYPYVADATYPQYEPLERNTTSDTFVFACGRTVSLGDRGLIQAIRDRDPVAKIELLAEGITFSDKYPTDASAQKFTLNGVANQTQALGINYQCESLVVFTLEPDDSQPYGVRIDVDVLLP